MVITEAMSCGVPPVSFTCPCGPRDIIHNNEDGLLVENGNIEQLAEKICYLIENDNIRKDWEDGPKSIRNGSKWKTLAKTGKLYLTNYLNINNYIKKYEVVL